MEDTKLYLGRLAVILRGAQEILQRKFGNEAADIIDEALQDFDVEVKQSAEQHETGKA